MKPFLKWAGGKRWLFTPDFLASLPKYERYIEPFVGGGAGFFKIEPENAIISDVNHDLITLYRVVRDRHKDLERALEVHQCLHSSSYYYMVREQDPENEIERAARFLYLNRTCWNGLYRLNRQGKFNVPIGTKDKVLFDDDDFLRASEILSRADIRHSDFEAVVDEAVEGDLLFLDPPYTVAHNMNGFVKYNEKIFSWNDQIRLRDSVLRAIERGAMVILTNADHESVREIYDGIGWGCSVERPSIISGKSEGRCGVTEFLMRTQCIG